MQKRGKQKLVAWRCRTKMNILKQISSYPKSGLAISQNLCLAQSSVVPHIKELIEEDYIIRKKNSLNLTYRGKELLGISKDYIQAKEQLEIISNYCEMRYNRLKEGSK